MEWLVMALLAVGVYLLDQRVVALVKRVKALEDDRKPDEYVALISELNANTRRVIEQREAWQNTEREHMKECAKKFHALKPEMPDVIN